MPNILLVFDRTEAEAASLVQSELMAAFEADGERVSVTESSNTENARSHLPGDFDLVIVPLRIRKTPVAPLSEEEEEGLELLRWMNRGQIDKPSILVAPTYTDNLRNSQPELGRCYVVLSSASMVQEIVQRAKQLIRHAPAKCLDIEIQLRSRTEWGYSLRGRGFGYMHQADLSVDEGTFEDLSIDSDTVASTDNWQIVLRRIGGKLMDAMFRDRAFVWDMSEGLLQAGGEANARVRFIVKPEMHGLALEAVMCPRTKDRYWMLQAPVYRRLQVNEPGSGGYLFEGGRRIDCLIIDATTSGLVSEPEVFLRKLRSPLPECDWVLDWLKKNQAQLNLGEVKLLRAAPGGEPMAQQVKAALESRDWGLVHYAGHSHYDAKNDAGYIFFPGAAEASIEAVELKRFSGWHRRVTFTYFSSCDSGAGPFLFALANRRATNILGFRWEIDDALAFEHAKEFYTHLFETRSLEAAFLKARQQMHELHPDDRIWAAPILVKQLEEA